MKTQVFPTRNNTEEGFTCPVCTEKYVPTPENRKYLFMLFSTHKYAIEIKHWYIHVAFMCPTCGAITNFGYKTSKNPDAWISRINHYTNTREDNDLPIAL